MLEIILLIHFSRKIGVLADRKGEKAGRWKLYVILCWFVFEFLGGIVGYVIYPDKVFAVLFAYAFAIGSYFLLRAMLQKKPDVIEEDWVNQIGVQESGSDAGLPTQ